MRHEINQAIGATMRRLLVLNDMHGSRTMREGVLDDLNALSRFVNGMFDQCPLKNSAPITPPSAAT